MSELCKSSCPLENLRPFLVAANVRGVVDTHGYTVAPGLGQIGDLVLGFVKPGLGQKTLVLDQSRRAHDIVEPQRILAVLGPRDSSTHVCATIPVGGIQIREGTRLHWIAGESGIVGCLEQEPPSHSVHAAEKALDYVCCGLVLNENQLPVNVRDFSVRPKSSRVSKPIVFVAASSSESGKTILAGKLIRYLCDAGVRVGALKVTGTGGVLDSLHHLQSGSAAVLDNVDAGLITTHCERREFRQQIPLIFRKISGEDIDLIVAELGGDILSANNPEVFKMQELMENAILLLVLSNDALAAAGIIAVNDGQLGFPTTKLRHITSPFRNHAGMARRMALAGIPECYNPHSSEDLSKIGAQIIDRLDQEFQRRSHRSV